MYFPLLKLYGWRKRSASQPQTICSEVLKNSKILKSPFYWTIPFVYCPQTNPRQTPDKQKEAPNMKRNQNRPAVRRSPAYPNAADNRYFLEKAVNIATAILSGIGIVFAMVFLVTMA